MMMLKTDTRIRKQDRRPARKSTRRCAWPARLLEPCPLFLDAGGLRLHPCPRRAMPFSAHGKRRASRRQAWQPWGGTTSAHPRPWNPTRAWWNYRRPSDMGVPPSSLEPPQVQRW